MQLSLCQEKNSDKVDLEALTLSDDELSMKK